MTLLGGAGSVIVLRLVVRLMTSMQRYPPSLRRTNVAFGRP
jgi:hypothetical protein